MPLCQFYLVYNALWDYSKVFGYVVETDACSLYNYVVVSTLHDHQWLEVRTSVVCPPDGSGPDLRQFLCNLQNTE